MITGHDFIALSSRWAALSSATDGEPVWRTAIGRAYYGAFHVAMGVLLDKLQITLPTARDKKNTHAFVQQALNNSGNADAIKAGGLLGDLHEYRKNADYDLKTADCGKQILARACVEVANRICTLLDQCSSHHPTMKTKIQAWQRDILKMRI